MTGGHYQQVDVLKHEDESGEEYFTFFAGCVEAMGQMLPPRVVRQQRLTVVAGDGQFVQVARLVKVLDELSMGRVASRA